MNQVERVALLKSSYENQKTTIMSYPERGPWGDAKYWGNWSGFIPGYFIQLFGAKKIAEIFAGGGTTSDVCRDLDLEYAGIDLNPLPSRNDIVSMDILDMNTDLPSLFYEADLVLGHPPYPSINEVTYSDYMWKDNGGLKEKDIQRMPYEKGMKAINQGVLRTYAAMPNGSYMVLMVGEIRSKGQYRSMVQDLIKVGIFHQTFVKIQHNTRSSKRSYSGRCFALTGQEMIVVYKKPSGYEIVYAIPKNYSLDIRDSVNSSTWKDVVWAVMKNLKSSSLTQIYAEIGKNKKAQTNPNWQAKVRQVLQQLAQAGLVKNESRGVWVVA